MKQHDITKFWMLLAVLSDAYLLNLEISASEAAISACEKGNQWQQALHFFDQLTHAAVDPNVISFNAAISSCEKAEQWQQALFLFQTMPHAIVQRNTVSFLVAISSCEKVSSLH